MPRRQGREQGDPLGHPGGWRENLTSDEHDVMHEVMGPKLAELGYLEPDPVGLT